MENQKGDNYTSVFTESSKEQRKAEQKELNAEAFS